ncbi:glycoside hydrolase family 95 protein-like protein [Trichodelitschia bisporula]|uniref:Glycoside hydrolase family 95 protein-like protein n=1 Tax=Trichodelitschia bisporula TaxID=703511 RepID=A0A6G1I3Z0_9PEZI|nr:glycoside hydrolase family 95 protein-like protein [Trichodelitschia bisporula]
MRLSSPIPVVVATTLSALSGVQGKSIWASWPASGANLFREGFLVGNGKLGAIPFGQPSIEKVNLNVDSLWSGGPFESSTYTGGNPEKEQSRTLQSVRDGIFKTGSGSLGTILGNNNAYGSYRVLANLTVQIAGINSYSGFKRSLDLNTGVHTTTFYANDNKTYTTAVYCSYPAQVCVYRVSVNTGSLPNIALSLENKRSPKDLVNATCGVSFIRMSGTTQKGPPEGMKYDVLARLGTGPLGTPISSCSDTDPGTLVVTGSAYGEDEPLNTLAIIIGAGTNYEQLRCNAASQYNCKGADPYEAVQKITAMASTKLESKTLIAHQQDYQNLMNQFTLELNDPWKNSQYPSEGLELFQLLDRYRSTAGRPAMDTDAQAAADGSYVEALLFDYARHLLVCSSRQNSLPANLQGVWTDGLETAWGGDYHTNINLQMNYWFAEQTGLGDTTQALWRFIKDTWIPRGAETARKLYGANGWVVHNEVNIFGHTGMKDNATWANYPVAAAWMMQHVFDHWDYTQDLPFLQQTGYIMMRDAANFWLSQLQLDRSDSTLVANPCNSPEHGPTTYGCTHFQQLIHQLFDTVLRAGAAVNDIDTTFITSLGVYLNSLDKGLHIGSWGQIKEWKVPDTRELDAQGNTHRHLSHLVGWYPGYSIAGFLNGYGRTDIQKAVEASLRSRGNGRGPDGNAGWEKIWRSACWARLNNTDQADFLLRYTIVSNFAVNGLSQYNGMNGPFQIDANFGIAAAMLSMLVVDLPLSYNDNGPRGVVLGPAIPARWGPGTVKGLRIRGGTILTMSWNARGLVDKVSITKRGTSVRFFSKAGNKIGEI